MNHDASPIQQEGRAVEVREETQGGPEQSRESACRFSEAEKARFWSKVARGGAGECWPWIACKTEKGYGHFRFRGKIIRSHRVAYALSAGAISNEIDVLHRCDNPSCCNPSHLFLGTHTDNMRDKVSKGRSNNPSREHHPMAKLSPESVDDIRILFGHMSQRKAAKQFGISQGHVWRIWNEVSWKPTLSRVPTTKSIPASQLPSSSL
jgi:hypothetical protein